MINRWHVWVWLGTQFLLTSIFTKKTHKLFLTVGSWLDMLMTQDASASANQKWVCWWLVELHRSEEKIGCNQIWEKGYTARPLDAGSIFNMGLTRLHFCLNWYDMLLGGKTSHAHIFFLRIELNHQSADYWKHTAYQASLTAGVGITGSSVTRRNLWGRSFRKVLKSFHWG